jgi:hypothetical protein
MGLSISLFDKNPIVFGFLWYPDFWINYGIASLNALQHCKDGDVWIWGFKPDFQEGP